MNLLPSPVTDEICANLYITELKQLYSGYPVVVEDYLKRWKGAKLGDLWFQLHAHHTFCKCKHCHNFLDVEMHHKYNCHMCEVYICCNSYIDNGLFIRVKGDVVLCVTCYNICKNSLRIPLYWCDFCHSHQPETQNGPVKCGSCTNRICGFCLIGTVQPTHWRKHPGKNGKYSCGCT